MKTVLVADDVPDELESLRKKLEKGGYQVIPASTPEMASDLLKSSNIGVAVIDVRLRNGHEGDRSGLAVARDSTRDIPKIMISGAEEDEEQVRDAFGTDADGRMIVYAFLSKRDVNKQPEKLLRTVKDAFETRRIWAQRERQSIQGQLLSDYRNARRFDLINAGVGFTVNVIFVGLIISTIRWMHAGTAQVVLSSVVCMGIVVSEVVLNLFLAKRLEGSGRRAESYHDELIQAWRFEQLLKSTDHLETAIQRNAAKLAIIKAFATRWNRHSNQIPGFEEASVDIPKTIS